MPPPPPIGRGCLADTAVEEEFDKYTPRYRNFLTLVPRIERRGDAARSPNEHDPLAFEQAKASRSAMGRSLWSARARGIHVNREPVRRRDSARYNHCVITIRSQRLEGIISCAKVVRSRDA